MSNPIENMATEEAVKKYLQPFVIQKYLRTNINTTNYLEIEKYRELSGFVSDVSDAYSQLKEQKINDILHSAMKQLELSIVIKRPPFIDASAGNMDDPETRNAYYRLNGVHDIIRISDKITIEKKEHKSLFGRFYVKEHKHQEAQFLCEIAPKDYIGKVPDSVIVATGKAVEANLYPQVWIAGTFDELKNAVQKQVDPIVIGYPNMNETTYNSKYGLLIAAWGKDLEIIDNYFAANSIDCVQSDHKESTEEP